MSQTLSAVRLDRYRPLRVIGEGSYGVVHEALDSLTGEHIALKELRHTHPASLARFKLEGRIIATTKGSALERIRFRHPLYDRPSPVYLGSYVSLEHGTGVVHSDGEEKALKPGSAAWLYKGAKVGIRQTGDAPLVLIIAYPNKSAE